MKKENLIEMGDKLVGFCKSIAGPVAIVVVAKLLGVEIPGFTYTRPVTKNASRDISYDDSDPLQVAIAELGRAAFKHDFDSNRNRTARAIFDMVKDSDNEEAIGLACRILGAISEKMDFDSSRNTVSEYIADLGRKVATL